VKTIELGNPYSWKPSAFGEPSLETIPKTVRGVIVYINQEHHYFTAEASVFGYAIRESFKMI